MGVFFPEFQNQVDKNWTSKREEGQVDKTQSDFLHPHAHFRGEPGTNTKRLFLKKIKNNSVHCALLGKIVGQSIQSAAQI